MENVCSDWCLAAAGFRGVILDTDHFRLKLQIELFLTMIKNKTNM